MTTLANLADIHGNLPALEAVARDMAQFPVERVIIAGDIISWGPFSPQVLERVTAAGWMVIRGLNEYYLLDYDTPRAPGAWSDREQYSVMRWLHGQLRGRWQHAIAAWPDSRNLSFPDGPPVRVVHGSPRSAWEAMYSDTPDADIEAMLAGVPETIVIAAHTHLAMDRTDGRWRVLNPGTVGVPLDGREDACYMLFETRGGVWYHTFRRIPNDLSPPFAEFERQRFVETCGIVGQLVMEEFRTPRLRVDPFNIWRETECPGAPLNPALLAEFAKVDAWRYIPAPYHIRRKGVRPHTRD